MAYFLVILTSINFLSLAWIGWTLVLPVLVFRRLNPINTPTIHNFNIYIEQMSLTNNGVSYFLSNLTLLSVLEFSITWFQQFLGYSYESIRIHIIPYLLNLDSMVYVKARWNPEMGLLFVEDYIFWYLIHS